MPVIARLYSHHIKVRLYSNTVSVPNFPWREAFEYIHTLCLPIDSLRQDDALGLRGKAQYLGVIGLVKMLLETAPRPHLRIGTVVNSRNKNELLGILQLLYSWNVELVWRLYQFHAVGPLATRNQQLYEIDDTSYQAAIELVRTSAPDRIKISTRCAAETEGYCHMMGSDGTMFISRQHTYWRTGATIFSPPECILAGYDDALNVRQKASHDLLD